jgi:hypothetical protein
MAGMAEGMDHADRSRVEPRYLLTGDPGYKGGGTTNSGDTQAMMSGYENVFGPAARNIKWDNQRHKRHQRWHLPDALKGSNSFLTDRIDGLITDATSSPFTKTSASTACSSCRSRLMTMASTARRRSRLMTMASTARRRSRLMRM